MKIIHLLDSLNRGGAEILALDLCRNAQFCNLDLTFVATGTGALKKDFRDSGAEFIELKRKFPVDPTVILRLRKLIKNKKAAVIHTHQAVEALHAFFAAKGTTTKVVLTHHGFVPDQKNFRTLEFLLPRVTQNIVVSRALLNWYRDSMNLHFPENTRVIHNGVDARRLIWRGDKLKRELNLPENSQLFGMIGNFYRDPRKDQLTMCRALPKFFAEIENAYFVFAGKTESGAENKFAECVALCQANKIDDRVFFLGGRSDIPKILEALDVFVLSSLHEGLPIAVLEAMLSGVPCILSDIEPLAEVSEKGEYARLFKSQNPLDLAEKLIELAKNKSFRLELTATAKIYAEERFSIEAHIENLKSLYKSIV